MEKIPKTIWYGFFVIALDIIQCALSNLQNYTYFCLFVCYSGNNVLLDCVDYYSLYLILSMYRLKSCYYVSLVSLLLLLLLIFGVLWPDAVFVCPINWLRIGWCVCDWSCDCNCIGCDCCCCCCCGEWRILDAVSGEVIAEKYWPKLDDCCRWGCGAMLKLCDCTLRVLTSGGFLIDWENAKPRRKVAL